MNSINDLIEEFREHDAILDDPNNDCPVLNQKVEKAGINFIQTADRATENFLCELLGRKNIGIKFSTLYVLLRAQAAGAKLQEETLEQLERIKKSKERHNVAIRRWSEKRINAEQSSI